VKTLKLYDYFRSGAAYRTRIALNLKKLEYQQISVNLIKGGGEQFESDYSGVNPQNLVPTLMFGAQRIYQSMAIMEFLEEMFPEPSLLPADQMGRARVRGLANMISCDTHPLNNLRVRLYLVDEMKVSEENRRIWIEHWIRLGFEAYEKMLLDKEDDGPYSYGQFPTMADVCLVPQVANARLNKVDLSDFPTILGVEKFCQAHPAFEKALPSNQPDAN
jgi:maleylacetoacetate isomerase